VGGFNLLADAGRKLTVEPGTIISQLRSDVNKQISSALQHLRKTSRHNNLASLTIHPSLIVSLRQV
jgi:hypothetical protein